MERDDERDECIAMQVQSRIKLITNYQQEQTEDERISSALRFLFARIHFTRLKFLKGNSQELSLPLTARDYVLRIIYSGRFDPSCARERHEQENVLNIANG